MELSLSYTLTQKQKYSLTLTHTHTHYLSFSHSHTYPLLSSRKRLKKLWIKKKKKGGAGYAELCDNLDLIFHFMSYTNKQA